jgi:transcriptional regulator with XRE-family HTH domain
LEITLDEFKLRFGANLRQLRKSKHLSSAALAAKSDLSSDAFILSIERGIKDIQLSTIFKLAKGLEVEPKELLNF